MESTFVLTVDPAFESNSPVPSEADDLEGTLGDGFPKIWIEVWANFPWV